MSSKLLSGFLIQVMGETGLGRIDADGLGYSATEGSVHTDLMAC